MYVDYDNILDIFTYIPVSISFLWSVFHHKHI